MDVDRHLFVLGGSRDHVLLYPFVDAKESPVDDETLRTWVTQRERERLTRALFNVKFNFH